MNKKIWVATKTCNNCGTEEVCTQISDQGSVSCVLTGLAGKLILFTETEVMKDTILDVSGVQLLHKNSSFCSMHLNKTTNIFREGQQRS